MSNPDLTKLNAALRSAATGMLHQGKYFAEVVGVALAPSKNSNLQIVYDLAIQLENTKILKTVKKFTQLQEDMIGFFVMEMNLFQVCITDMNDLPDVLESIEGSIVEIEISYNENFRFPVPKFLRMLRKPNQQYAGAKKV